MTRRWYGRALRTRLAFIRCFQPVAHGIFPTPMASINMAMSLGQPTAHLVVSPDILPSSGHPCPNLHHRCHCRDFLTGRTEVACCTEVRYSRWKSYFSRKFPARAINSAARVPPLQGGSQGFESLIAHLM